MIKGELYVVHAHIDEMKIHKMRITASARIFGYTQSRCEDLQFNAIEVC